MQPHDARFFDWSDEFDVQWDALPHWSQSGAVVFVTWRTADSIPTAVIRRLASERDQLLIEAGVDPADDWRSSLARLEPGPRQRIRQRLLEPFDSALDGCLGTCPLQSSQAAEIVASSLLRFDSRRYVVFDFVIMPNHVHVLVAFRDAISMRGQVSAWKRFQARSINAALCRRGSLWQEHHFDHLVRSERQFQYLREYIRLNGPNAGLSTSQYRHWSRVL